MIQAVFMGSPEIAVPSLRVLADHQGVAIRGVFAQPDRPAGRGRKTQPCAVRAAADELGLAVYTPERVRETEALATLEKLAPDLIIVCAYGQILPRPLLDLPPLGCFNLHFSLLPRWRGASPVQAAILAGDRKTGVSLQRMVMELDAGPLVAYSPPVPLDAGETSQSLSEKLALVSADLLRQTLPILMEGNPPQREQDARAVTHCRIIPKSAGEIHWAQESALEIERKTRAYSPWPGCFSRIGGKRLGILGVDLCGDAESAQLPEGKPGVLLAEGVVWTKAGALRLNAVKPEGKGAMDLKAFLNGQPHLIGEPFTDTRQA